MEAMFLRLLEWSADSQGMGLASLLCDMGGPLSDLQRFLAFSNGAAVSQCACLTTPRPVGPPCELAANLVRLGGAMTSSTPPSMAATIAHTCRPLVIDFYTRPIHTHGRTVSPCVGMPTPSFHQADRRGSLGLTCEVTGDSAYAVSSQEGQRAGPAAEVTCGLPATAAVAYTVVFIFL